MSKFVEFDIEAKPAEQMPVKTIEDIKKEKKIMTKVNLPEKPGLEFGIDETKDVVLCGVGLANGIISAMSDGKLTLTDFPAFIGPLMKIPGALSGIEKVPAELSELTEIELDELKQVVKDNLDVDEAKAKEIVEKSINAIYEIYDLIKTVLN